MVKITNELSAKELKQEADKLGIEYQKNANVAQMKELLSENGVQSEKAQGAPKPSNETIDVNALLKTMQEQASQIKNLENLVRETGDTNKIKDFDKQKVVLNKFAFSVKLFPTRDYDCPIISWKTISNFVDLSGEDIKSNQIIEITYLTKDGEKHTKEIELVQFATFLKRSEKIIAKSIKNLDGTDVYISKQINPETKLEYYVMNPEKETFNVNLEVNGQELTILSTYLNA